AMAVVPASCQVGLTLLKTAAGAKTVELATEGDFKSSFPDCETGAMPPFGNLYDMQVFADEALSRDPEIAFNAGSHRELVRMAWSDFNRLVNPRVVRLGVGRAAETAAWAHPRTAPEPPVAQPRGRIITLTLTADKRDRLMEN